VLLETLDLTPEDFAARTGWELKPEGACQKDVCVPLARDVHRSDGTVDVESFAAEMDMPLVGDAGFSLWALGPRAGGRVIDDDNVPDVVLEGFDGNRFDLASLRGRKVLLLAWASW
jgi:hypothetical protein